MTERIEAWLRTRDAARFQADMNASARSVERVGAAGKKAAGGLAAMGNESLGASAKLKKAGLAMDATGRKMESAGGILTRGVTKPILAVGAASAWMSAKFTQDMTLIETQAGAPRGEIAKLRGQVLGLAKDSTFGPDQLAKGLFHLESIGLRGKKAMNALRIASQGAMVGNADLESVTTALGSAWLVNIKGAGNLHHVMALLNATVGAGNVRMGDLVQALGTGLLPAAKQAGLNIKDVFGAMAVFTDEGYQASSAAAQFSTALHFLYNPTTKASNAMETIGMSSDQMAKDMRKPQGLLVALRDLHDHLNKLPGGAGGVQAEQILGQILPGGRGRIMLTLLNQLDRYQMKMGQITKTSKNFGNAVKQSQETPLNRLKKAWSSVQVSLVKMGDVILPELVPLLSKMGDDITAIFGAFDKLDPKTRRYIVTGLALLAVLGPMLKIVGLLTRGLGLFTRGLGVALTVARYILLGQLPKTVAAGEAAAGAETAAAGGTLGKIFGGGFMKGFARLLGGVAIASFIAQKLHIQNADPLLFLHPPKAGDPNEIKKLRAKDHGHKTILESSLKGVNNYAALLKRVKSGKESVLTNQGLPLLPGMGADAVKRAAAEHRRLLRQQHHEIRHAARNIFNPALPRLSPIGHTSDIPVMPFPPQWFDKLKDDRPIIVQIDGKEVARAVAKDTKNNLARR